MSPTCRQSARAGKAEQPRLGVGRMAPRLPDGGPSALLTSSSDADSTRDGRHRGGPTEAKSPHAQAQVVWRRPARAPGRRRRQARVRGGLRAPPPGHLPLLPLAPRQPGGRGRRTAEHDGGGAARPGWGDARDQAQALAVPDRPQRMRHAPAHARARGGFRRLARARGSERRRARGARAAAPAHGRPPGADPAPAQRARDAGAQRPELRRRGHRPGQLSRRRAADRLRGAQRVARAGGGASDGL